MWFKAAFPAAIGATPRPPERKIIGPVPAVLVPAVLVMGEMKRINETKGQLIVFLIHCAPNGVRIGVEAVGAHFPAKYLRAVYGCGV